MPFSGFASLCFRDWRIPARRQSQDRDLSPFAFFATFC